VVTAAASAPYSYDPDAMTVTCRACRVSAYDVLPEQAGPWHAGHRKQCSGTPGGTRPPATVLQFPGTRPAGTQGRQR
jgi:hypothetical protein